jgi:hypothetical protein
MTDPFHERPGPEIWGGCMPGFIGLAIGLILGMSLISLALYFDLKP